MQRMISWMVGAWIIALAIAVIGSAGPLAAAQLYVFEAKTKKFKPADDVIISVRIVNTATGEPVDNAVIYQTRLDMSPDNMAEMTSTVTPLPAGEPGIYRFKADMSMTGRWALKLAAKVPGEPESVRGEVILVTSE